MQVFKHLVGIPYDEMDCFSLAKKFYKDVLGKELKHYFDSVPEDRVQIKNLVYTNVGDFVKTDNPKFGDLILLRIKGLESHIAVNLDGSTMLHTMKPTGSVIDRKSRWATLIVGYYTLGGSND
jgi:hypothetical protein